MNSTWKRVIDKYSLLGNNIYEISEKMRVDRLVYPPKELTFNCFNYFAPEDTKVVILGQDPYHGPGQATGLAFGVPNNLTKLPPSLNNIKKELKRDLKQNLVDNTLESWANQGVLLMNTALTVEDGKPASHAVNWMGFSDYIIDYLNKNMKNLVYVAWGAFAYNKLKNIDTNNNVLLVTSHPSPLSANSKFRTFPAFMGSDIFNNINKHLINLSKEEVVFGERIKID